MHANLCEQVFQRWIAVEQHTRIKRCESEAVGGALCEDSCGS